MEKQRVSYAEFVAQQEAKNRQGTVAWVINRYMTEMNGWNGSPPVRLFKASQIYTLKMVARSPIGNVMAALLTRKDVIEHATMRQAAGIKPQTVMQDLTFLSGALKYAGSNPKWEGCEEITAAPVVAAKPFLLAHGLIGKSARRTRRPTSDELEALIEYFEAQNRLKRTRTDMVRVTLWQNYSGRRISETCRLLWTDWDRAKETIVVRAMKDPKRRDKTKTLALTPEAQQFLVALWDIRDPDEKRIFPYCSKTCSARHTLAKHALAERFPGIETLRLHDNRRDRCSKLVEQGYSPQQGILVSGHDTVTVFEQTYMQIDVGLFKQGPQQAARA